MTGGTYCARCGRPNPERARYCSNCGAPLMRNANTGSFGAIPNERGGETTSIISPVAGEPEYSDEPSPDYSAVDTLPPGTALLVVLRGPNAGSRFLLDSDFTSAGRHPDSDIFLDDVIFAADGRGGFVVPEFSRTVDGIAAFVRLLGLVARTRLTLSQIDARIPQAHLMRRSIPTPWAAKGAVMRTVMEAAGNRPVDTTDGVRIVDAERGWALVLPDPADAVTHLWVEGGDADSAQLLLDEWAAVVEQAGE